MRQPVHPGEFIRARNPGAARVVGHGGRTGPRRLAGRALEPAQRQANLSGDMALRIEKAFGVRMETLMRMHSSYDIVQTRQRAKLITVRRYRRSAA